MLRIFTKFFTLSVCVVSMSALAQEWKSIDKNEMNVQWKVENDSVLFRMAAPTNGWIALGYHTKDQLKGSTLIMASLAETEESEKTIERIEEHFILKPGTHKEMAQLNKKSVLNHTKVVAKGKYTMARFSMPIGYDNGNRIPLIEGNSYYFILAFSESDDFDHHSTMRTSVSVVL